MAWIELELGRFRREIERCSVQLFALNALGVQEDFFPESKTCSTSALGYRSSTRFDQNGHCSRPGGRRQMQSG